MRGSRTKLKQGGKHYVQAYGILRKDTYKARGKQYELLTYRVKETGEYEVHISANGFVGDVFCLSHESNDAGIIVEAAKSDIGKNEDNKYDVFEMVKVKGDQQVIIDKIIDYSRACHNKHNRNP